MTRTIVTLLMILNLNTLTHTMDQLTYIDLEIYIWII